MEPIILPVPKKLFTTMLIGCAIVILAPLRLLFSPLPGATTVAIVGIVFIAAGAIFFVIKLNSSAPMLVIDSTGVTDNASAVSAGFLHWHEISRVEIKHFLGNDFLCFHLVEPEAMLARMNPLKRVLMRINARCFGAAHVNLPMRSLEIAPGVLMANLQGWIDANRG
ncbi:STM3941 family protein [Massilia sp. CF038]|uniref:STM3941 family protein n=1 Tax=Massilia sp. CF038 TaxID=1881045 RepID=UPI00091F7AE0|nr:STM3941 family protein [Massilia sp. CF038]SHG68961.1 hypothetical protein SAMN05428948_1621 [Massilia sp. CF038]